MVYPGGGVDDDIVQVCHLIWSVCSQDNVHQALKGCVSSVQAEWENPVLPVAAGGTEDDFGRGLLG